MREWYIKDVLVKTCVTVDEDDESTITRYTVT